MSAVAVNTTATLQYILQHYSTASSNSHVQQVLDKLQQCRTAALGYHLYKCSDGACNQYKYQYHSCRNRHCPACGSLQKEQWIEQRRSELLPISYYHVVFTIPHELNSIILGHRKHLYKLLFDAASQTILSFAKDPQYLGATPGILAVLHSWGQQLSFHPHLHCIVSGGGMATTVQKNKPGTPVKVYWKTTVKDKYAFLFPVKAMAVVYRAKYLQGLKRLIKAGEVQPKDTAEMSAIIQQLYNKEWVVYAKKPFGGPQQVIEYLGRYTHKVAITNNRIEAVNTSTATVKFKYKDYATGGQQKKMELSATEFIRRFEQHILPKYFTKIRSYGYLANRNRKTNLAAITKSMNIPAHPALSVKTPWQVRLLEKFNIQHNQCPGCRQASLVLVRSVLPHAYIKDG